MWVVSGGLGGAVGFFVLSSVQDALECLEKVEVGLKSASGWMEACDSIEMQLNIELSETEVRDLFDWRMQATLVWKIGSFLFFS